MSSNYFNDLRTALHSGNDAYGRAQRVRAERSLGWRDDRTARADAIAQRAAYDATCK